MSLSERRTELESRVATTIDVHAHVGIRAIDDLLSGHPGLAEARALEARRTGPISMPVTLAMLAERMPRAARPEARIADMDRAGVDMHLLSPSPGQYNYWAEPSLAAEICTAANEEVAGLVRGHPARFGGVGLVPLQHPELMLQLLDHAVVAHGLSGVEISSFAPAPDGGTIELSDPRLEPFWTRAEELDALVFMHPLGCTLDERLDRFYLSNVVGQPVESAIALSHLIVSGVLDRHQGLQFLASHGGGYLTTYLGRFDHAWTVREDVHTCENVPSSYLPRLYFDSLVHTPEALRMLVDVVGADRIMLGSDYPFDMGVNDPIDRLLAANLTEDETDAIAGLNAARLGLVPDTLAKHRRDAS